MGKNSNETTFSMHWMMHNNVLLMIVNIIIIHAVFFCSSLSCLHMARISLRSHK